MSVQRSKRYAAESPYSLTYLITYLLTFSLIGLYRQTKLDEALLSSGRISDALQALMEWLGKAESYLTEDQPLLGDLDTVTMLLEQHKV